MFDLKKDECKNNPMKTSTTKVGEHISCGYSVSTIWTFDGTKTKHELYRGNGCMKRFFKSLKWYFPIKTNSQFSKSLGLI